MKLLPLPPAAALNLEPRTSNLEPRSSESAGEGGTFFKPEAWWKLAGGETTALTANSSESAGEGGTFFKPEAWWKLAGGETTGPTANSSESAGERGTFFKPEAWWKLAGGETTGLTANSSESAGEGGTFFKPEAWWKLAGGETTGPTAKNGVHPGRGGGRSRRDIPAPLPGCIPFGDRVPVVSPPANLFSALRAGFVSLLASLSLLMPGIVRAEEPFFKKGDVIALVGGEDMVAMSEYGYLELLLQRALPDYHLKFRDLAWEGDTVFEQRRDLNFPTWEQQLDQIGATVVICQFGQMESLAASGRVGVPPAVAGVPPGTPPSEEGGKMPPSAGGKPTLPGLPEFIAAYEKLLGRFGGGGKRRVVVLSPGVFEAADAQTNRDLFAEAVRAIKLQPGGLMDISPGFHPGFPVKERSHPEGVPEAADAQVSSAPAGADSLSESKPRVSPGANIRQPSGLKTRHSFTSDGVHLSVDGQMELALRIRKLADVGEAGVVGVGFAKKDGSIFNQGLEPLRQLIIAKNRLWFDYWRVQNWAFLAGDRTEQPSSRDHFDRTKRWFPAERERFLPLIEAKEQEIWALAAKLAQGDAQK